MRLIDVSGLLLTGCDSNARVGIGASSKTCSEISRRLAARGSDVRLVRYARPADLVTALRRAKVDAAVRGVLSSGPTISAIKAAFGLLGVMRTAILEDSGARGFLLTPVGIDEGNGFDARLSLVKQTVSYFRPLGWIEKIGVLSKGRLEDIGRGEEIRRSVEEGDGLTRRLKSEGLKAKHHAILIEDALKESDLVVAPDGVTGNLVFRSVHFIGGCNAYGAPVVNLGKIFVDTSRAKADFSDSVLVAAALAETRG